MCVIIIMSVQNPASMKLLFLAVRLQKLISITRSLITVEQMKAASVSQLEAKREELTVAMQSTQAGCDFVANLLSDGSDVDVLQMEAQVK